MPFTTARSVGMSPTPIDPVRKPDPTILNPQPPKKVECGTTVLPCCERSSSVTKAAVAGGFGLGKPATLHEVPA